MRRTGPIKITTAPLWTAGARNKNRTMCSGDHIPPGSVNDRRRNYDEYIANLDGEFGRLLDFLEAKGILDQELCGGHIGSRRVLRTGRRRAYLAPAVRPGGPGAPADLIARAKIEAGRKHPHEQHRRAADPGALDRQCRSRTGAKGRCCRAWAAPKTPNEAFT